MLQERSLMGGVSNVKTAFFKVDLFIREKLNADCLLQTTTAEEQGTGGRRGKQHAAAPPPQPPTPTPPPRLIELPK